VLGLYQGNGLAHNLTAAISKDDKDLVILDLDLVIAEVFMADIESFLMFHVHERDDVFATHGLLILLDWRCIALAFLALAFLLCL
jgi:hypothetical protein